MDRYLTTEDVAEIARTSPATVRYWKHMGTGPRSAKIGRRVLYRERDVMAWFEQKYDTPSPSASASGQVAV